MGSETKPGGGTLKRLPDRAGTICAVLLGVAGLALTWALVWNVPNVRGLSAPTYPYSQDLPAEATDPTRGAPAATEGRWALKEGEWYFLGADGAAQTGWAHSGDCWYYLRPADDAPSAGAAGTMVVGWADIDGYRYYFDPDGAMRTGRLAYDGFEYYLADGRVFSDRISFPYGSMVTGFVQMGGFTHYYAEEPCLQLFLWGSYPEGALASSCAFADWGGSMGHASSGRMEGATVYYDVVL